MAKVEEYEKLEDDDILVMVDNNIRQSIGYYDSDLARERKKVADYYNATLPRPAHDGNSRYVSQDVYDSVESMKAALLETFSSGNKIVKFAPQGPEDVQLASVCSAYTDYVLFRQNDGFGLFRSVIHDGLVARVGTAKVFWQEMFEEDLKEFTGLTQDELDMVLSDEDVDLVESDTDEQGLLSGIISTKVDTSKCCVESIPPEELLIESQAVSLDSVNFVAHRTRKTLSELREMGFSEAKLDKIGDAHEDVELETDPEILARHDHIGADRGHNSHGYQDQVRNIMVYEAYIYLDIEATGVAKLHRVLKAGNVLLDVEQVNRIPFVCFAPLPIPHAFYGSNFAEKLVATQNARTVLTRSILDHAMITNNPRYMVVKGGLTNPRELIDNRVGGLVNVSRPDAISPMPQASLNPFVFQTLQLLDEDKEDNTGVSRLSQGLNKDALSKQNSAAMVEQLATMSQQRQKIIARNFANQFVKPLFHMIYQICVENENQQKIIDLSGEYVMVDPSVWESKRDVMVQLHLGYGEQEAESQKHMAMHQLFSQDPSLAPMYQPQNAYALIKDAMEQAGILNVSDYLTPPDQLPQPQPDPAQQMQMEMAQKQMELQERQTAVAEAKAQVDAQVAQMKMQLEQMKAEAQHALQSDNQDLKEQQFKFKQFIDSSELEILKTADDLRGIASPTG
jgi:hypothetical protein